jgi:hypothetical protein
LRRCSFVIFRCLINRMLAARSEEV